MRQRGKQRLIKAVVAQWPLKLSKPFCIGFLGALLKTSLISGEHVIES